MPSKPCGRLGLLLAALATPALADEPPSVHIPTPSGWRQHDVNRPKPPVVEPGSGLAGSNAPKDAVILFDGHDLSAWKGDKGPAEWKVADGVLEVVPKKGAIQTKEKFGDVQLHVEWASPNPPKGKGQGRGNSGIFLMGEFEVQVLDTYNAETYADGMAGALYGQYPPLYNATKPPGEWQAYDIAFRAPRFESDGSLREPARATVFLNGVLVQDGEPLTGYTKWLEALPYRPGVSEGPLELQDHGHQVRFRNIWLRKLPSRPAPSVAERAEPKAVVLSEAEMNAFVGTYGKDWKLVVTRNGDRLNFKIPQRGQSLEMVPTSPTHFEMPRTDASFDFEKDAQGKVVALKARIADGGEARHARLNP